MPDDARRDLTIRHLGVHADGVSDDTPEPTFIRYALPGERWRVGGGFADERLSDSPERIAPVCPHFGVCGGCAAQHMSPALYATWKTSILKTALVHRGLDAEIAPMRTIPAASRRRAVFGVRRSGKDVLLGFRIQDTHTLVDLATCAVLEPSMVALLPELRSMGRLAVPEGVGGRIIVTMTDTGPDVGIETGKSRLSAAIRKALAEHAAAVRLARLTVDGEAIALLATPTLSLAGAPVQLPAGAFLQASAEAERVMTELVAEGVGKAKAVADLFCGLGTFTLPLARRSTVSAYDGDKPAIAALADAVRHAQGLRPITTRVRDLFREPLSPLELKTYDAVVFDPPRAGARAQAESLARASLPTVVAVSCNPATLARDLRTLVDGGYRIRSVTPVDQFVFTPHLEVIAVLTRDKESANKRSPSVR